MSPCYLPYLDAFSGVVVPPIDPARRADMVRLLELGWRPDAIAEQLHVSQATVYNTERNLMRYGQPIRPCVWKTGRLAALTKANREALLKLLLHNSWKYLDEIQYWLYHECNFNVIYFTIHCVLKKEGWLKRVIRRIVQGRNSQLRELYCNNIRRFPADIIVFLNKAIFNKKTG